MQIPILNGIYANEQSDLRTSYPVNLIPVPKEQGISAGYLRPADGIDPFSDGPGQDRGGIRWNDTCYRISGTRLIEVSGQGVVTDLGEIPGVEEARLDYSFDYLGIVSNQDFYLYDGVNPPTQVTDPDLGDVIDFVWVDGYFMLTDGEFLIVTDLTDPFSINPLKYGSSEADPDPVKALIKVRNEPHALNRYTIEAFDNVGGTGFPFQRIDGAQIQKGTLGTKTCCLFLEALAFVGGGRNESIAIWIGAGGQTTKISTREIDQLLAEYTEEVLSTTILEARVDKGHQFLYLHLPDRTLGYDAASSQVLGEPVWFVLTSSLLGFSAYRAKNLVWCYNKWIVGDPISSKIGVLTDTHSEHYNNEVRWEFNTTALYNKSMGAIIHRLELICLTGRVAFNKDPRISTSYSVDGETYSQEKSIRSGKQGNRTKRLIWLQQGHLKNWRIQRFRGTSSSFLTMMRLEAEIEPLGV